MGRQPFQKLRDRMTREPLAEADALADGMMTDMLLSEIRKSMGLTQQQVAEAMGISQPSLSKLENQEDMQRGTLRRLIEAFGGEREIVAHLPHADVRIRQLRSAS